MWRRAVLSARLVAGACGLLLAVGGCFGSGGSGSSGGNDGTSTTSPAGRASDARRRYPLDSLPTTTVSIDGHELRVWVVQESDASRPRVVQEGLMHVPPEEIADDQGMLFVFSDERERGFWMLNTITPLDIAYARMNGTIVKIWQMPPQTLETFPSIEPVMFALEVKQGTFAALGIQESDRLEVPEEVLKTHP